MNIFASLSFFIFLAVSVPLFHLATPRWRHVVLIVSGICFYSYYAGWWVLLFFSELLISRFYRQGSWTCWLGVLQAVAILAFFKYGPFIEHNIDRIFDVSGTDLMPVFAILPLAISFFTFEFIHYAVDFKNGKVPERSFLKYAAFIFFFPTLVAGPIKRYQDFVPKVESARLDWNLVSAGVTRILLGFFKKFVIADSLVEWTKFLSPETLPGLSGIWVWQGVFAYGLRIYFDFSGYADIAIGTSYLFGIVVPENFNNPYFSRNISEFWKRWHISLYRWLVDYIFIPLGGSRGSTWKTCRNILIVTGVSGLWHGASWHFVIWGWYHGVLLCILHLLNRKERPETPPAGLRANLRHWGSVALTFVLVMFGWTFFALETHQLSMALKKMFFLE